MHRYTRKHSKAVTRATALIATLPLAFCSFPAIPMIATAEEPEPQQEEQLLHEPYDEATCEDNQVIVVYKDEAKEIDDKQVVYTEDPETVRAEAAILPCVTPIEVTTLDALGAEDVDNTPLPGEESTDMSVVTFEEGTDINEIMDKLALGTDVDYVQPNYTYHEIEDIPVENMMESLATWTQSPAVNDPCCVSAPRKVTGSDGLEYYLNQAYIYDTNINKVWEAGVTGAPVSIGIVDNHLNPYSPETKNLVNNELSYDIYWDQPLDNSKVVKPATSEESEDTEYDWTDSEASLSSHGTNVASEISAEANNGKWMAGASYNSQFVFVNVFPGASKTTSSATIAKGIKYLATLVEDGKIDNMKVMNLSLGGMVKTYGNYIPDTTMHNAIVAATNAGILCVAAAGNSGDNLDDSSIIATKGYMVPASYEEVVCVAAAQSHYGTTTATNSGYRKPADFTNYGSCVDISAPGTTILCESPLHDYASEPDSWVPAYSSGTSQAAPLVTSTVALLAAAQPDATLEELRSAVVDTAADNSSYDSTGHVPTFLDAYAAYQEISKPRINSEILAEHTSVTFDREIYNEEENFSMDVSISLPNDYRKTGEAEITLSLPNAASVSGYTLSAKNGNDEQYVACDDSVFSCEMENKEEHALFTLSFPIVEPNKDYLLHVTGIMLEDDGIYSVIPVCTTSGVEDRVNGTGSVFTIKPLPRADYTVKYWFENADDEEFSQDTDNYDDVVQNGVVGRTTIVPAGSVLGFDNPRYSLEEIAEDGSTVVNVYYDRLTTTLGYYYNYDNEGAYVEQEVKVGSTVVLPQDPGRMGYDFSGWYTSPAATTKFTMPATAPLNGFTAYAGWTPGTNTPYSVTYLFQSLPDANGGTTYQADTNYPDTDGHGTTLEQTNVVAPSVVGFRAQQIQQQPIQPNGSTKIVVKYDRNKNNLARSLNYNGAPDCYETQKLFYQQPIVHPTNPVRTGYDFSEWTEDAEGQVKWAHDTMPNEALAAYAQWVPRNDTQYTIKYWFQNTNGNGYDQNQNLLADTKAHGTTEQDTAATAPEVTGFKPAAITQQKIAGDGSTVVDIQYIRNSYSITFNMNYANAPQQTVRGRYEAQITYPTNPKRNGYEFAGWYADSDTTQEWNGTTYDSEDITVYAKWLPATNTPYKIQRFFQPVNGATNKAAYTTQANYPALSMTGTTGITTSYQPESVPGFTVREVEQTTIAADGSSVVNVYYNRATVSVSYFLNYAGASTDAWNTKSGLYGAQISMNSVPSRQGYIFSGWYTDANVSSPFTMTTFPVNDVQAYAKWSPNTNTPYTVHHMLQPVSGTTDTSAYAEYSATQNAGTTGSQTKAAGISIPGFTAKSQIQQATIAADGSTNVYVYYDRNTRSIYFDHNYQGSPNAQNVNGLYGADFAMPAAPTRAGYDFAGWFADAACTQTFAVITIPADNATAYAKWNARSDTQYKVRHVFQNVNGDTSNASYQQNANYPDEAKTGTTGATALATDCVKNVDGFTMSSISKTTISGDGNAVVTIYYNRNSYSAKYEYNYAGAGTYKSVSALYGASFKNPTAPSRSGYKFAGWYEDAACTKAFTPGAMPIGGVSAYAKWDKNPQLIQNGTYVITTALNGSKALDISAASMNDGANAQMYTANDTNAQRFNVRYNASDDTYTITNYKSGKVLTANASPLRNGTNVCQKNATGANNQKWRIKKNGNYYTIESAMNSMMVLDIAGGSTANFANVQVYPFNGTNAQKWKFTSSPAPTTGKVLANGTYTITSKLDAKKVIDISGASTRSGANAQLWQSNGTNAQKFRFEYDGKGYYKITCVASGKVLDVSGASTKNGANIQQWASNGTNAQKWAVYKNYNGTYTILSKTNGKVMDVSGASTRNGANVQCWEWNGTNAQRWTIK